MYTTAGFPESFNENFIRAKLRLNKEGKFSIITSTPADVCHIQKRRVCLSGYMIKINPVCSIGRVIRSHGDLVPVGGDSRLSSHSKAVFRKLRESWKLNIAFGDIRGPHVLRKPEADKAANPGEPTIAGCLAVSSLVAVAFRAFGAADS